LLDINYRIVAVGANDSAVLPMDKARVVSKGFAGGGGIIKTLEMQVGKARGLNVFNFSLYQTGGGE